MLLIQREQLEFHNLVAREGEAEASKEQAAATQQAKQELHEQAYQPSIIMSDLRSKL